MQPNVRRTALKPGNKSACDVIEIDGLALAKRLRYTERHLGIVRPLAGFPTEGASSDHFAQQVFFQSWRAELQRRPKSIASRRAHHHTSEPVYYTYLLQHLVPFS
jgi:hypothetical protein